MKKKKIILLLAVILALISLPGTAETFGGDLDWPTFHGMQLGLSMPYVLLQEEYTNGYQPELISPFGKNLEEISEEDLTNQLQYRITTEEVCGIDCEIIYVFTDNIFTVATITGNIASQEKAEEWIHKMEDTFTELYGEETQKGAWMKRTSQLPYNTPVDWEGHVINYLTREYIRPIATINKTALNGGYKVSASIQMWYTCTDYEELIAAFNWDGGKIFPDDGKQSEKGLTVEEIREKLGEAASDILDAKYHDSRYYRG